MVSTPHLSSYYGLTHLTYLLIMVSTPHLSSYYGLTHLTYLIIMG